MKTITYVFGMACHPCVRNRVNGSRALQSAFAATPLRPQPGFTEYLTSSRLWFESFQNWQSEFLAIASMVWLGVYLRQQYSPESKPVHASHDETGR